jgi:hypothetical protein
MNYKKFIKLLIIDCYFLFFGNINFYFGSLVPVIFITCQKNKNCFQREYKNRRISKPIYQSGEIRIAITTTLSALCCNLLTDVKSNSRTKKALARPKIQLTQKWIYPLVNQLYCNYLLL